MPAVVKPNPIVMDISHTPVALQGQFFVTGTDTEIGKTTVTGQLIKNLAEQNKTCYAIKPVTAGLSIDTQGQYFSEDGLSINQFATIKPPLTSIAPILLTTPSSPHIAGQIDGVLLSGNYIVETIRQTLQDYPADTILIEGAGGWFTPINEHETLADVAAELNLPVIMVVGIKLGCLNHAVLTVQAILQAGLPISAIVFNHINANTQFYQEQVNWLIQYLTHDYFSSRQYQHQLPIFLYQPFQFD